MKSRDSLILAVTLFLFLLIVSFCSAKVAKADDQSECFKIALANQETWAINSKTCYISNGITYPTPLECGVTECNVPSEWYDYWLNNEWMKDPEFVFGIDEPAPDEPRTPEDCNITSVEYLDEDTIEIDYNGGCDTIRLVSDLHPKIVIETIQLEEGSLILSLPENVEYLEMKGDQWILNK